MKRIILSIMAITIVLAISTYPVFAAGGGHLWFYSQDPDTIPSPAPQPLPDPELWDPNYNGVDGDPWKSEGILISSGDWETFTIWLGCKQFESLGTKLVLSINDAAFNAIDSIKINGIEVTTWDTSGTPPAGLAPHGVFNSAEFYGYTLADLGNLYSPSGSPYKTAITIEITLNDGVPEDAKIHFDAYGYTEDGSFIFSPYSHDGTFVVPELCVLLLVAASFSALALYAIKRKSSN